MIRVLMVIGLLAVVAGLAVYWFYAQDIAAARLALSGRGHVVATSLGAVEYAEAGQGEPVLAIHGTGGGFDQGLAMAGRLAAGYRLIAPSRFGYLGSAYPDGASLALQADAFAEMLDALGIQRAFVFGGSAGALSAMEFAIRYPDRCTALALLVPAAYAPTRKPNASGAEGPLLETAVKAMLGSDFLFWGIQRALPDAMVKMLLATEPALVAGASPSEQARVRAILFHILPVSVRAQGLLFYMKTAGDPARQAIDKITCPVLTISSRDDLFGTSDPAEYIAATVADGRSIIFPTGGHVWVGHDDEVWAAITSFFAEHGGSPANTAVSVAGNGGR